MRGGGGVGRELNFGFASRLLFLLLLFTIKNAKDLFDLESAKEWKKSGERTNQKEREREAGERTTTTTL